MSENVLIDVANALADARRLRLDGQVQQARVFESSAEAWLKLAADDLADDLLASWECEVLANHPSELPEWSEVL